MANPARGRWVRLTVARRIMGTTVIGGMLAATLIAVFLIPVFFVAVERMSRRRRAPGVAPAASLTEASGDDR